MIKNLRSLLLLIAGICLTVDLYALQGHLLPKEKLPLSICRLNIFSAFGTRWVSSCSGTLISPSHILSAAHCSDVIEEVAGKESFSVEVTCGQGTEFEEVRWASFHEKHPDYLSFDFMFLEQVDALRASLNLQKDVQVLELDRPIFRLRPIRFSRSWQESFALLTHNPRCFAYGFGYDEDGFLGDLNGTVASILHDANDIGAFAEVPSLRLNPLISGSLLPGDSGGPILCLDETDEPILIGVISGKFFLDSASRVDSYADWIEGIVNLGFDRKPE